MKVDFDKLKGKRPALAVFALVATIALLLIAAPIASLFAAQSDDTGDALHRLAIYRAEIASRGELESQLEELHLRAASEPGLVKSDNSALAEAQIQSDMKTIVEVNQGEVRSAQPLAPTREGGFEVISVAYDIVVPLARLKALAYAIESHASYFFINDAELTAGQAWDTGEVVSVGTIPKLEIRWTIRAYRWSASR